MLHFLYTHRGECTVLTIALIHTHQRTGTHTLRKANDNCYTHSYDYDYCYDDNVVAIVVGHVGRIACVGCVVAVIVWLFALALQ